VMSAPVKMFLKIGQFVMQLRQELGGLLFGSPCTRVIARGCGNNYLRRQQLGGTSYRLLIVTSSWKTYR